MGTPQICQLVRSVSSDGKTVTVNRNIGIGVFAVAIGGLVDFMAGTKAWTDAIVLESATIAYNEYYWFTLAELKLFTIRVKAGHYTSMKNFIPPVLMEMLLDFSNEMHAERGKTIGMSKKSNWQPPAEPVSDERFKEIFTPLLSQMKADKNKEEQDRQQRREAEIERIKLIELKRQEHERIRNNNTDSM